MDYRQNDENISSYMNGLVSMNRVSKVDPGDYIEDPA
jgi:hypothetical protein